MDNNHQTQISSGTVTKILFIVCIIQFFVILKHYNGKPTTWLFEFVVSEKFGFLSARGVWKSDKKPWPETQETQIQCTQSIMTCVETTAGVTDQNSLHLDSTYWDIVSWGKDEIVLRDNVYPCAIAQLKINIPKKSVIRVRVKNHEGHDIEFCKAVDDSTYVMYLSDNR